MQELAWDDLIDQSQTSLGYTFDGLLINGTQDYDCPCKPGQCFGPEHVFSFTAKEDGWIHATAGPFREAEDLGMH